MKLYYFAFLKKSILWIVIKQALLHTTYNTPPSAISVSISLRKIVCVTHLIKDHMFVKYKYIQNNKLRSFSSLPFARPARGPIVISSLPSSRRAVPITFSLTQGSTIAFSELKGRRLTKQSWKNQLCFSDHINMESNQQIISNGYHRTGKRVASAKQVVLW